MNSGARAAVLQVLDEAARQKHFFDFSDAERLAWMIERAFVIGVRSVNQSNHTKRRSNARHPRGHARRNL